MKHYRYIFLVAALILLFLVCACSGGSGVTPAAPPVSPTGPSAPGESTEVPSSTNGPDSSAQVPGGNTDPAAPESLSGLLVITFDYERQSGSASNQFAVWIEDTDGNIVRTLFTTRWTVNGGFRTRSDAIATWAKKSGLANMASTEIDAISGPTPRTGPQSYTWDLTDKNGDAVPPGDYVFIVEGTMRWKNHVIHSGVITLGTEPVTVLANADFVYIGDLRNEALTSDSEENNLIGPVTAVFTPTVGN